MPTKRQERQLLRKQAKRRLRRPGYVKQESNPKRGSVDAKRAERRRKKGERIDLAALEAEIMAEREDA